MVTFNSPVKFRCPTNSLHFPLAFSMLTIFCAKESYFRFSIVQNCGWGIFSFDISMDFQLIIDCGEGRSILRKSSISDVLQIFVLNKNRRKKFLLVSFHAYKVVQLRTFLLGCCTLSLDVHCLVFQDHILSSYSRVGH